MNQPSGLVADYVHGGPDLHGVAAHDLSTNSNACGPYEPAAQAVKNADARHYPDPAYTALSVQLAAWHGVAPSRIVVGASGSELIQRITVAVALQALATKQKPSVWLPRHAYGDYKRAAQAAGLPQVARSSEAGLLWACDPSSPFGAPHEGLAAQVGALQPTQTMVLDLAYEPLRLQGALALESGLLDRVWRLITPNKSLGLTGVRAAYLIAPQLAVDTELMMRVRMLAPSWPLGGHGVALLQTWATVAAHEWLAGCRRDLKVWKDRQLDVLQSVGWGTEGGESGVANFLVVSKQHPGVTPSLEPLRALGFKLRDCTSFGLPGRVRMAVVAPPVQDALIAALKQTNSREVNR